MKQINPYLRHPKVSKKSFSWDTKNQTKPSVFHRFLLLLLLALSIGLFTLPWNRCKLDKVVKPFSSQKTRSRLDALLDQGCS